MTQKASITHLSTGEEELPELLSLSAVAKRLQMKPSNVAKFLARRGIKPDYKKAQGHLWREDKIEAVKAEREADAAKMEADRKRREAALARSRGSAAPPAATTPALKLGTRQQLLLAILVRHPVRADNEATRSALRRLRERALVEPIPGDPQTWQLTDRGWEAAGLL